MYDSGNVHMLWYTWWSIDNLVESLLSYLYVGSVDRALVLKLA